MSRLSSDQLAADGTILNGFDYNVQVWVLGGVVQPCNHPESMQHDARLACCQAYVYGGKKINQVPGHEVREVRVY